MRIWIDCLTPKQLVFYQMLIDRLGRRHRVLFTSRTYGEVAGLARVRGHRPLIIGRFGGGTPAGKLEAAISRMGRLLGPVRRFDPDLVVSSTSPDAARIAFGLGKRHLAFSDAPHETAIMRLVLPLTWKLLTPRIIPKEMFTINGIKAGDIVRYNALDGAVTMKRKVDDSWKLPFRGRGRKILVRVEEEEASYARGSEKTAPLVRRLAADFAGEDIVVLARYAGQAARLRGIGGARVVTMSHDGIRLLRDTDVFVGSGGTMTVEAAMMGVPTVSYRPIPNVIDDYLVERRLIERGSTPGSISARVRRLLDAPRGARRRRAARIVAKMEDPFDVFERVITQVKFGGRRPRR